MSYINLCFNDVSFTYESSEKPIIKDLTVTFPFGWTGIIGPNGIGKTTLAKLAVGLLEPDTGAIYRQKDNFSGLYCPQTTEFYPDFCNDFFGSEDNLSGKLRSILEIEKDWLNRWDSLSHGERKRLQIAIILWKTPDILVLDEPTNHLDNHSLKIIIESLSEYEGIGLLISHNRMLLDKLCNQCLFMSIENTVLRPGGISEGLVQEKIEEKNKIKTYENAQQKYQKIKSTAVKLRQEYNSKAKSLSKKGIAKKDFDAKAKIDAARLTGKDSAAARIVKRMDSRVLQAKEEIENSFFKKRTVDGFIFNGEIAKCNTLVNIEEGILQISEYFKIKCPGLVLKPADKIGITGNNGTGKSTLIEYIYNSLKIDRDKVIYIPQEMDVTNIANILNEIHNLSRENLGKLMTVIFRLGSEPERLLKAENPSPGELKKLMLGLGLLKTPVMIIMDEPTNHMDFPSIECLEEALSLFNGALLLVSHDNEFIKNLTNTEWNLVFSEGKRVIGVA